MRIRGLGRHTRQGYVFVSGGVSIWTQISWFGLRCPLTPPSWYCRRKQPFVLEERGTDAFQNLSGIQKASAFSTYCASGASDCFTSCNLFCSGWHHADLPTCWLRAVGAIPVGLCGARELSVELRNWQSMRASCINRLENWLNCYQDENCGPKYVSQNMGCYLVFC